MANVNIEDFAEDLFTKLNAVPALVGKVGLTSGGKANDPSLAKMPLPGAWAVFTKLEAADPLTAVNPRIQTLTCRFSVMLFIAYSAQSELIATQYPIITAAIASIRGTDTPNGMRWHFYDAEAILINPDRLGYELRFSTTITL